MAACLTRPAPIYCCTPRTLSSGTWGEEALQRAREENKLIFLSLGYASCYWCHVLARTTFADQRVVETLNEHFISILVNQEERPDLDNHFMEIMQAMVGLIGSPANYFNRSNEQRLSYIRFGTRMGRTRLVNTDAGQLVVVSCQKHHLGTNLVFSGDLTNRLRPVRTDPTSVLTRRDSGAPAA